MLKENGPVLGICNTLGSTHHTGCVCWEAKKDAEIASLQDHIDRLTHERDALRVDAKQLAQELETATTTAEDWRKITKLYAEEITRLRRHLGEIP